MRVDFFMGRGPGREWLGYLEGDAEALQATIAPVLRAGTQENYRSAVALCGLSRDGSEERGPAVDYFSGRAYFHAAGQGQAGKPKPGPSPTTPTAGDVTMTEAPPAEPPPEGEEGEGTPGKEGSEPPAASSPVSEAPAPPRKKKVSKKTK